MKKSHMGLTLEYLDDKLDLILEAIAPLGPMQIKITEIDARLTRVESDVKVIKKVVTATNRDLKDHERRITDLENETFGFA
jgi:hypothetical protein